ncbi:MAG: hypothetical protein KUG64_09200 [Cycloclasticus sp.]|nr:hypothetical protein [Cycloclasticus sp.]
MSFWKFAYIDQIISRVAPDSIPLSTPGCLANDFFQIYITIEELGWRLLCTSKEKNGYSGFLWVENKNGTDATLLAKTLEQYEVSVEITHYYKCYEFKYEKALSFLLSFYMQRHLIHAAKDKLLQSVFNRKTLVRSERIEILNYLVEKTIEEPSYTTDPIYLGLHLHSKRWFFHPKRIEHQAHYRLLLDSLVESGELKNNNRRYCVTDIWGQSKNSPNAFSLSAHASLP